MSSKELLKDIKEELRITWDDEDDKLKTAIERGQTTIATNLLGANIEDVFKEEGEEKALLFDYVRYYYNNALEYFEDNFHQTILRLQIKWAVIVNARKETENEDSK